MPAVLRLNDHSSRRVAAGYPWVFRSEIADKTGGAGIAAGDIVDFVRSDGKFLARGFFNPKPQLVGRVLTHDNNEKIDAFFVRRAIESAVTFRDKLYGAPYYRLVHAESDGFPGLIIDRYGDVIVAQINTAGMERMWPDIESALMSVVKPKTIVLRNDTAAREAEGLVSEVRIAAGDKTSGETIIMENGAKFSVDVLGGQKTGWFFDQRDNRNWVASLSKGATVADIFCHTGGFGVTAAVKGARHATFVDSSANALQRAMKNAELNGVEKSCEAVEGAAFDVMEKMAASGKTFDIVCVDPPAFVKSRKDLGAGLKGYQKLARLAAPLVTKGGLLFFASCSSHVTASDLAIEITGGLGRAGRSCQLVKTAGAGADHPIHPHLPETEYLKALTFRLDCYS